MQRLEVSGARINVVLLYLIFRNVPTKKKIAAFPITHTALAFCENCHLTRPTILYRSKHPTPFAEHSGSPRPSNQTTSHRVRLRVTSVKRDIRKPDIKSPGQRHFRACLTSTNHVYLKQTAQCHSNNKDLPYGL